MGCAFYITRKQFSRPESETFLPLSCSSQPLGARGRIDRTHWGAVWAEGLWRETASLRCWLLAEVTERVAGLCSLHGRSAFPRTLGLDCPLESKSSLFPMALERRGKSWGGGESETSISSSYMPGAGIEPGTRHAAQHGP